MKSRRNKVIIIHPGIQHLYRLGNALSISGLFSSVKLYTWFTLSAGSSLAKFGYFKKRIKVIDSQLKVRNFLVFEFLLIVNLKINEILRRNNGNNTRYRWQFYFCIFLLPFIYIQRKDIILILTETAAWPLSKFAKKWGIPVIIDFPSISHEEALKKDIIETPLGIKIKSKERNYINYSIHCSKFAADTYYNKTSAKKQYIALLGADSVNKSKYLVATDFKTLNIACIANTEKRKGIDLLLSAFAQITYPEKKLHLIGNLDKEWVINFCNSNKINNENIYFTGPLDHCLINKYLVEKEINLHVLASRFDSFAMVVPETMMLGIPNIVSPFVGAGEMLDNEVDGFIMKDLTAACLLSAINKFISLSHANKLNLKTNVLRKAENMTWEHYNLRVKPIFEEITTLLD
jgi:glycosyltransferase involved in cell wall biosynthesis